MRKLKVQQQDRSGGSYNNVIYLLIAIKAWQICLGPIYDYLDGRWLGHALRKPEAKRRAMTVALQTEVEVNASVERVSLLSGSRWRGWRPSKTACAIVGTELMCAIVVAWVVGPLDLDLRNTLTDCIQLYIVYSIGI